MVKNKALTGALKRLDKHPPKGLSEDKLRSFLKRKRCRAFAWSNSTTSWPDPD
jgi:hypothetical protein